MLVIALFLCLILSLRSEQIKTGYKTCEITGLTHLYGFHSSDLCLRDDAQVLLRNTWLKVYHIGCYKNDTFNKGFLHNDIKFYVEFFNGESDIPIGIINVGFINCFDDGCTDCSIDKRITSVALKDAVKVYFRKDSRSGHVVYFYYESADVTFYMRRAKTGFNFGIHMPAELSAQTEGMCQTGCPVKTQVTSPCFNSELGKQVCDIALNGSQASQNRYEACVRDVFMWKDATAALDHRLASIDSYLIQDFYSFDQIYFNLMNFQYKTINAFQKKIIDSNCLIDIKNK